MSNSHAAIHIQGVTKTFGPKVAVRNLDLVVEEGALCGFIGPNGAGKTTTIRMIMSIIFPDDGTISVLGKASAVESKDRIGYLPEERGVYRKMRVGAFLNYMARLKGISASASDKKVRSWLERMQLSEVYKKRCEELSKGMQQKVQFISAVIHEPDLLILDEVFSGLDPQNRRLMRVLLEEQHASGKTLIFSTHAMFEAEQLCTHLFMIHKGEKMLDAPVEEVWRRFDPRTVTVAPMNGVRGSPERLPGVRSVRVVDDQLDLLLEENADPSEIMRLVTEMMPVRKVELKRANLEDIFISLCGGDAAVLEAEKEPVGAAQSAAKLS